MNNTNENEKFKKKIMNRVYAIWLIRKLTSAFALETAALILAVFGMAFYVSFGHIFANMSHVLASPIAVMNFIASAFMTTQGIVKVLFAASSILSILVLKNLATTVAQSFMFSRTVR